MLFRSRLTDTGAHPGTITGSHVPSVTVNGLPIAVITDAFTCPLPGHGINVIANGAVTVTAGGLAVAYMVGSKSACGAAMVTGSPTVTVL